MKTPYSLRDFDKAYKKVAPRFHSLFFEDHLKMLKAVKQELQKGLRRKRVRSNKKKRNAGRK